MSPGEREAPSSPIDPGLVRERLLRLYKELDARVAELGPVCKLSGRCCRFREEGHVLFLSAVEAALLVADAPPPYRPLDDGATCPWQDAAGRCGARGVRPLGCRVYFCDPGYQGQAELLSEEFLARLRRLVDLLDLPWNYARLHDHLAAAEASGLLRLPKSVTDETPDDARGDDTTPGREVLDISPSDQ